MCPITSVHALNPLPRQLDRIITQQIMPKINREPYAEQATFLLPEKAVQIWVLHDWAAEETNQVLGHVLSQDERQRAVSYRHIKHQSSFIYRRCVLRCLIGHYLGYKAESLLFELNPFGKPALRSPYAPGFEFSISQTDGLAVLAFAWDCRVGVDVEKLASDVDIHGVGQAVFSDQEQADVNASTHDASSAFFTVWTRKEALLKAVGTGLSGQPGDYITQDEAQHGRNQWRASHKGVPLPGWTFLDLELAPGVKCALAVSRDDVQVSLRHFTVSDFRTSNDCIEVT